jgi:hydrogenase maturation protease
MKIAVVGIGQSLRGDDAVGPEAVRLWQEKYPETANLPGMHVDVREIPGLALLDLIDGSEAVILVDAVKSSAIPGTLHQLSVEQLSSFTTGSKSAHGWGVAESLHLDRILNPSKQNIPICLIGIEAEQLQIGSGLSATVTQILPKVCEAIQEEVHKLLTR